MYSRLKRRSATSMHHPMKLENSHTSRVSARSNNVGTCCTRGNLCEYAENVDASLSHMYFWRAMWWDKRWCDFRERAPLPGEA